MYLNLGCGDRYFSDWVNLDFQSNSPSVSSHNLKNGIPYKADSFEIVYHSHLLEHLPRHKATFFLKECYRVLKIGGVLRVVVPDLENIVLNYLSNLIEVRSNPSDLNKSNYEWSILELFDQMVREKSGGEMAEFWLKDQLINEDFIASRMGHEFVSFREKIHHSKLKSDFLKKEHFFNLRIFENKFFSIQSYRNKLLSLISGIPNFHEVYDLGKFRTSGEVHQWMYDSYSLGKLLAQCGFKEIKIVDAFTSSFQEWDKYMWLDVEEGDVRKPDSLFMEARK